MDFLFVLIIGLIAGTLSGIVGFGSSIMLMPVLVVVFGPLQSVPIMAVAATMANLSRILVWWREVEWRACAAYAVTGIPAAALGAKTLLVLSPRIIESALGAFFILMIPARRWLVSHDLRVRLWHLAAAGAAIGFVTGIVVSTGPITVPIFLAYGLVKGAYIGTEALATVVMHVAKLAAYGGARILSARGVLVGLALGPVMVAGSWAGKRIVDRLPERVFVLLIEITMAAAGLVFLIGG